MQDVSFPGRGTSFLSGALAAVFGLGACNGTDGDVVAAFTHHYVESDPNRPFAATFLGIPAWQNPCDMWVMQEILSEVRPDFVVETGTAHGGSALYYAAVLSAFGDGRVITIDVDPKTERAQRIPLWRERVEQIVGDSTAPATIDAVRQRVAGKRVVVTLDSLHTRAHVAEELGLYSELVSPGSYLVVQDTVIDRHPEWIERYASYGGSSQGPAPAVEAFLADQGGRFEVDRSREKFLFTFHPGGYLKRSAP